MNIDLVIQLNALGFKLALAVIAYAVLTALDWWWTRRNGVFKTHLAGADPQACAIYLGLRRLSAAVLVGLVIG